jgi:alginate O-acetyltransferase complex protein AlgI
MVFSSILFLFRFLPAALLLYYISPPKLKNFTLLICSLVFYCWGEIRFLWIMAAVILLNYACGLMMERFATASVGRKCFLALSVGGSLAWLLYFKYANFFVTNANGIFGLNIPLTETIVLPLGISFYTFQCLSYSIDVYRKTVPCEKNIATYGAYVAMFPQLIAGPIIRYKEISERLREARTRVTLERINEGAVLFVFGLAKKVLLADGINRLWTDIVGRYEGGRLVAEGVGLANVSTTLAWLGIIAYTLYIYNDFSGYSLMAIGLGKMLGFDFPMNFNLPYTSRSVTEFWRRWHITLSQWFREYVYIPLGGNRKGLPRQILNLFIVWMLTGFWHGANWNFILWGLYYCAFLIIEKIFLLKKIENARLWPRLYLLFIVAVGWALFVGNDPGVGLGVLINKLFVPQGGVSALYFARNYAVIMVLAVFFSSGMPQKIYDRIKQNTPARVFIMMFLFVICVAYMAAGGYQPFLYFNF